MTNLTKNRLSAIIDALNFCLADDWDESSHDQPIKTYEEALEWACEQSRKREERQVATRRK